jgi:hypothetical protein
MSQAPISPLRRRMIELLRLLPAGAVAGWDLHPLENAALSRRTPIAVLSQGKLLRRSKPLTRSGLIRYAVAPAMHACDRDSRTFKIIDRRLAERPTERLAP